MRGRNGGARRRGVRSPEEGPLRRVRTVTRVGFVLRVSYGENPRPSLPGGVAETFKAIALLGGHSERGPPRVPRPAAEPRARWLSPPEPTRRLRPWGNASRRDGGGAAGAPSGRAGQTRLHRADRPELSRAPAARAETVTRGGGGTRWGTCGPGRSATPRGAGARPAPPLPPPRDPSRLSSGENAPLTCPAEPPGFSPVRAAVARGQEPQGRLF